jgi:hypothetical protein
VVSEAPGGGFRARHTLIAEKLVEQLQPDTDYLTELCADLAFALAVQQGVQATRRKRRFLQRFLHHERLFRLLNAEGAETVYRRVEDLLSDSHHYWLQRGSLHNQHADHVSAETFLGHALALEPHDPLVQTEHAHMLLKKACRTARAAGAVALANQTIEELRRQNGVRGHTDIYPVHILCVQGLRWSRCAPISYDQKKELLNGLRTDIRKACARFPRKKLLQEIRESIERELLGMAVSP